MSNKSDNSVSTEVNTTEANTVNKNFLIKIDSILKSVIEENKKLTNYKERVSSQKNMPFTSYNKASVSILDYLIRIQNYTEAEDNTIILGVIYLDRFNGMNNSILTYYLLQY